ncbi:MAG: hypothetical protein P4M08_01900 [Oligoflexia bacterium]|nr:hypothetical protein [Oligoflexia bacterium]
MKTNYGISLSSLCVGLTVFAGASAFAANSGSSMACSANAPTAIRFEIASLAIIRAGGPGLGQEFSSGANVDDIEEKLCADASGYSLRASRTRSGYTDVTVNFSKEDCGQTLLITSEGKIADSAGEITCKAK